MTNIKPEIQKTSHNVFPDSQDNQIIYRLLIRMQSVNRSKGVKLRLGYDHIAPSGLVMPIKWVTTAMFTLVRIRPMFEQEAPK